VSDFEPTPAEDYPVVKDIETELPSGAKAILRRPSELELLGRGRVPADIVAALQRQYSQGDPLTAEERWRYINILICASYRKPRVSPTAKKDHVLVSEIPDVDKIFVINTLGLAV
jgi:hypothetical protein